MIKSNDAEVMWGDFQNDRHLVAFRSLVITDPCRNIVTNAWRSGVINMIVLFIPYSHELSHMVCEECKDKVAEVEKEAEEREQRKPASGICMHQSPSPSPAPPQLAAAHTHTARHST